MSSEVGSGFVRIRPNMTGFKGEVESGMRKSFSGVAKIAGEAFAGYAIGKFVLDSVEGAGKVQKSAEAIHNEFGKASESVIKFGEDAAKSYGISTQNADALSARFGILLKNLGIGKDKSAEMTVGLEKLAGSLGNIRGVDPSTIMQNLPMALSGNLRSLKQLGFAFNSTQLQEEAMREGLLKEPRAAKVSVVAHQQLQIAQERLSQATRKHGATSIQAQTATIALEKAQAAMTKEVKQAHVQLDPATKAMAIYGLVTKNLGEYQHQAASKSGDLINQQFKLRAELENADRTIGRALLPDVTKLVTAFADHLPGALTLTGKAVHAVIDPVDKVVQVFGGWKDAIVAVGVAFGLYKLAAIADGIATAFVASGEKVVAAIFAEQGASEAATAAYLADMTAMEAATIGLSATIRSALISTGIGALLVAAGFAAVEIIKHWDAIKQWLIDFGHWIKAHAYVLISVPIIGEFAFVAVEVLKHWNGIKEGVQKFIAWLTLAFTHPIAAIKALFRSLVSWFTGWANDVANVIGGAFKRIPSFLPGAGVFHSWGDKVAGIFGGSGKSAGEQFGEELSNNMVPWLNKAIVNASAAASAMVAVFNAAQTAITSVIYAGTQSGVGAAEANRAAGNQQLVTIARTPVVKRTPFTDTSAFGGDGSGIPSGGGGSATKAAMDRGRQKLIQFALSALGKPYLWGGSGPNSFDCSGLVMWAFGNAAGISLPHSTYAQVNMGRPVSIGAIKPGDVVFTNYGESGKAGPGHEGLYIGGGMVEEAPHKGDVVKKIALSAFIAGGQYAIRDLLPPGKGGTVADTARPKAPPLLPPALVNEISRLQSRASALNNTGSTAKMYLERERDDLEKAASILKKKMAHSTKGSDAYNAYAKAFTSIEDNLDQVKKLVRDAVIIAGDALLPPALRTKLTNLRNQFKAMSAMATVLTGDAAAQYQDEILSNIRDQQTALKAELEALKAKLATAKGKQRTAIQAEFKKVQAGLSSINDQLLGALEQSVQSLQGRVSSIFGTIKAKMDSQFEAATQRMVDALGVKFFQGSLTPAEAQLQQIQLAKNQKQLQDALQKAQSDLFDALHTPGADVASAQDAVNAAQEAIDMDRLQAKATAERAAADKAYADAVKVLQEKRAAEEQAMNDALDAMLEAVLNGTGSLSDLNDIAAKYGVSISDVAIPEMGKLVAATADLAKAFRELDAFIRKMTGTAPATSGQGAGGASDSQFTTPAWTDPGWWIGGLAEGGIVKRRPGGTAFRLGEGAHDEAVIPLQAGGGGGIRQVVAALHPLAFLEKMHATNREILDELRRQSELLGQPGPTPALAGTANASAIQARR